MTLMESLFAKKKKKEGEEEEEEQDLEDATSVNNALEFVVRPPAYSSDGMCNSPPCMSARWNTCTAAGRH